MITLSLSGARACFTGRAEGDLRGDPLALAAARDDAGLQRLVCGPQVHGIDVAEDDRPADGRLARTPGVGALVFVADCLPVALAGPGGVCMAHAGWRGLAGGVLEAAADAVQATHAVIGPGAGPCCYEVGPEVFEAFGLAPQRARIDMKALATERLAGLEVQDVGVCTICSPEHFSYRRDKTTARQAGIAWLT